MGRPVTLFTGQWADLPLKQLLAMVKSWLYDGVELACWGDHFDPEEAVRNTTYCKNQYQLVKDAGLDVWAISTHLVGQAVCDNIDIRHKAILPAHIWGDGDPEGVRQRAAEYIKKVAIAAKNFADIAGHEIVVNGFTGSSIWHLLYSFPPVTPEMIEEGFADFARRWDPIMKVYETNGIKFGLEVHPTEIAFDIASAEKAIAVLGYPNTFGFNYDPSHLGYQGVDYIEFIRKFGHRIWHVHMKDVYWSSTPARAGVFGGHTAFGTTGRFWDFRSLGRGCIRFEEIIRALNDVFYLGPLSVEWEDSKMNRLHGAKEACALVKALDFPPAAGAFDAAFARE